MNHGTAKKRFTPEEVGLIKRHYDGTRESAVMLANRLNRSVQSIQLRAHRLGVASEKRRWTTKDIAILKATYDDTPESKIRLMAQLNRSYEAISYMAHKYGLTLQHRWSIAEDDLLEQHYTKLGGIEFLTRRLTKRSPNAIRCRAYVLGLNFSQKTTP